MHNVRIIAFMQKGEKDKNRFSKKLIVSTGVSWNEKNCYLFVDPGKTKANRETCINFLQTSLLPECHLIYLLLHLSSRVNDSVFTQE